MEPADQMRVLGPLGQWTCLLRLAQGRLPSQRAVAAVVLSLLVAVSAPAHATTEYTLPSLFDVAGVAADDVLNIREAPGANARIVGELSPDARNIEVVGFDASGKWARINAGEQTGWVAFRFLRYRLDVWQPQTLPASLQCRGTEPFWSFTATSDAVVFSTPEVRRTVMPIDSVLDTGGFRDTRRSVTATGTGQSLTAIIVPMACSDGMSDRAYGLDVTVLLETRGNLQMLTGCCSVAP